MELYSTLGDITLEKWLKIWLYKLECKPRTWARYSDISVSHLMPALGKRKLNELQSAEIENFLEDRRLNGNLVTGDELRATTVNLIRTVLLSALGAAKEAGLVTINVASQAKRMRVSPRKPEAFSREEQQAIELAASKAHDPRLIGVKIALYTGLRLGELLALTWADVDLVQGIIHVTKSVSRTKSRTGEWQTLVDMPKTTASIRAVPVPGKLLSELRKAARRARGAYVVAERDGSMVNVRTYQYAFQSMLRRNKIRRLNFHALRHTFATRIMETGIDVKTLSELLGHESVTTTLKVYAHSFMYTKKRAIEQLNRFWYSSGRAAV